MSEKPKYYGLCETCDHDPTCTLRRSSQLKIVFCEEFETRSGTKIGPVAGDNFEPTTINHFGLCANCLNVLTCGFPNARHNVLHCEEYVLDQAGEVSLDQPSYRRSAA